MDEYEIKLLLMSNEEMEEIANGEDTNLRPRNESDTGVHLRSVRHESDTNGEGPDNHEPSL